MYYTLSRQHMYPPLWDGYPPVPMMAVASSCYSWASRRILARPMPPHCRPLACDSGGFVFASKHVDYPFTPTDYVAWLEALQPDWAACMDYPVEIEIAPHADQVRERQHRTVAHAATLLRYQRPWQWVPVLQGRTIPQYQEHAALYQQAGLVQPFMGIGSLCRRTSIHEIVAIAGAMANALPGVRFHLFGVKVGIFTRPVALPESVASADSAAWNGMFGRGRTRWKQAQARGLTQRQHERDQLYVYKAKVDRALAQPKQLLLVGERSNS